MGARVLSMTMRTNGFFLELMLGLGTMRTVDVVLRNPTAKSRNQEKRHELRFHSNHHG
jgi:hypothetical protein